MAKNDKKYFFELKKISHRLVVMVMIMAPRTQLADWPSFRRKSAVGSRRCCTDTWANMYLIKEVHLCLLTSMFGRR